MSSTPVFDNRVGSMVAMALVMLAFSVETPAQLSREVVATGFTNPVYLTAPPADTDRLFVVERAGRIRIIRTSDNTVLAPAFLDISGQVDTSGEGGLLGLAFHPDYASNGFFFVYYTTDLDPTASSQFGSRVSRFTVSGNAHIADAASETVFFELAQPFQNHNGGMIAFRPHEAGNYLYVGLGDGGGGCDPGEKAQDITNKFGTILRIDVDAGPSGDLGNPSGPASNPFVGVPGDDLIWVYGLRNPFRFSFDRQTGGLYIGDVGQNTREEISFQDAASTGGENYGWDAFEGSILCPCPTTASPTPDMIAPIHDYDHNGGSASVTGGFVYRGSESPGILGRYFFADFVTRKVWSFVRQGSGITDLQEHTSELNPSTDRIAGFGEGGDGELYICEWGGTITRIVGPDTFPAVPLSSFALMFVALGIVGAAVTLLWRRTRSAQ